MSDPLRNLFEGLGDVFDVLDDPTDTNGTRAEKKGRGERGKIVAWLRRTPQNTWTCEALAAAIERGDHLK